SFLPVAASHNTPPLLDQVTTSLPSSLTATMPNPSVPPRKVCTFLPVPASQMIAVESHHEPVTTYLPSLLRATDLTSFVCPSKLLSFLPVDDSHNIAALPNPVTMSVP